MRISLLTLILGLVVGLAVYPLVADPVRDLIAKSLVAEQVENPVKKRVIGEPPAEISYIPVPKIMEMLKGRYAEAVVVVLADESYDDRHKLTVVEVKEVWKGPDRLVGKTMNQPLQAPLSYLHAKGKRRVLKFMLMTPHLNSSSAVAIRDGVLGMNPEISIGMLRESLTTQKIGDQTLALDSQ